MKYIFSFFALFLVVAIFLVSAFQTTRSSYVEKSAITTTQTVRISPSPRTPTTTTLFVPYWTLSRDALPTKYDALAYFGITADENGINTAEDGYTHLSTFMRLAQPDAKKLLVVRLITPDINEKILGDSALQQKIIAQTIAIAERDGFDGIVLDFEYNALAFDSVVKNITTLSQTFASQSHAAHLLYYQTLYGDTFYRARPFNVAAIGKVTDGIFVMAYDFHKVNGNPGPNFPLHAMADEDYSFTQMVQDFTGKVSVSKLTILFGLFGYDWATNNKQQSLSPGNILTTQEAEQKFTPTCVLSSCKLQRDKDAEEQHVIYTDKERQVHEVWFEDMTSVGKKQEYLKSQGIFSTGFWAHSYF